MIQTKSSRGWCLEASSSIVFEHWEASVLCLALAIVTAALEANTAGGESFGVRQSTACRRSEKL